MMGAGLTECKEDSVPSGIGFSNNNIASMPMGLKRRRYDSSEEPERVLSGRLFLSIREGPELYDTEDWRGQDATVYIPLTQSFMLNIKNIDQVSFVRGLFVIGTPGGMYEREQHGHAFLLWRYSERESRNVVVRSLMTTSAQFFDTIQSKLLEC